MDLIQPFINSADAVLAQGLGTPVSIENLSMEEEAYRRKGIAAEVYLAGEIEGRIIFDVDMGAALELASRLAGVAVSETDEELVREAVCELANQFVVGLGHCDARQTAGELQRRSHVHIENDSPFNLAREENLGRDPSAGRLLVPCSGSRWKWATPVPAPGRRRPS